MGFAFHYSYSTIGATTTCIIGEARYTVAPAARRRVMSRWVKRPNVASLEQCRVLAREVVRFVSVQARALFARLPRSNPPPKFSFYQGVA